MGQCEVQGIQGAALLRSKCPRQLQSLDGRLWLSSRYLRSRRRRAEATMSTALSTDVLSWESGMSWSPSNGFVFFNPTV